MKDMIAKVFTWQYFEPVLFTTIGVLLLLLIIVLILSKKGKNEAPKEEAPTKLENDALTEDKPVEMTANKPDDVSIDGSLPDPVVEAVPNEEKPVMNMETNDEVTIPEVPAVEEAAPVVEDNVEADFEIFKENPAPQTEEQPVVSATTVEEPIVNPILDEEKEVENSVTWETPSEDIPPVVVADETPVVVKEEKPVAPLDEPVVVTTEEEKEEIKKEEPVIEEPVAEEAKEEEYVPVEVTEEKIHDFKNSFADLASSINKELEEINKMQLEANNPKENASTLPSSVNVTPIDEATKTAVSDVFSAAKPVLEEQKEDDLPLFKEEDTKSTLEVDLPSKKLEEEPSVVEDTPKPNVPDFSAFETETYNINKE